MKETYIHSFKTRYEENAIEGINYLRNDLDIKESKVFFEQAKRKKFANFEDDQDRQFTLSYNTDGTYTLIRRAY